MSHFNGSYGDHEDSEDCKSIAQYIFEIGHLKSTPRSGWALARIEPAESVADHSFRTAIIGYVLACREGADPARTVLLCLFHDTPETRLGDIPSVGKHYLDVSPEQVVADQTSRLPANLREGISELLASYDMASEQEALLARDADRLECLAQAIQYVEGGSPQAKSWIKPLMAELSSESAIELAEALQRTSPSGWWRDFVENYRSSVAR